MSCSSILARKAGRVFLLDDHESIRARDLGGANWGNCMESMDNLQTPERELAPIALFCFRRPAHLARVLEALRANALAHASTLYLFCDGPRGPQDQVEVEEVRRVARAANGFAKVEVRCSDVNRGLAQSIISGVTEVVGLHGRVIVLEDDLVTSPFFLTYMNEALSMYEDAGTVASIHGYLYPISVQLPETFFLRGADCWGWATWARAWSQFEEDGAKLLRRLDESGQGLDFDLGGAYPYRRMLEDQIAGRNDSWAIRWHASVFLEGGLTLYPGRSLVLNIGLDSTGTHSRMTDAFGRAVTHAPIRVRAIPLEPSEAALKAFASFFRSGEGGRIRHLLRKMLGHWPWLRNLLQVVKKNQRSF